MALPNDFAKYYKTVSNAELLSILEDPKDYKPEAIEAARNEFTNRNISEIEVKEIKEHLFSKQLQKEKQQEKIKAVATQIKNKAKILLDTLNLIQPELPTTERIIRIIVVFFGLLFLYSIVSNSGMLQFFLHDFRLSPVTTIFLFLPFFVLPIAIFFFWKRKQIGWTLLTIYLTFSLVGVLLTMFMYVNENPSGFSIIKDLSPTTSMTTYVIQVFFITGTLYIVCKQNIREVYSISTEKVAVVVGTTALFSLLSIMAIS